MRFELFFRWFLLDLIRKRSGWQSTVQPSGQPLLDQRRSHASAKFSRPYPLSMLKSSFITCRFSNCISNWIFSTFHVMLYFFAFVVFPPFILLTLLISRHRTISIGFLAPFSAFSLRCEIVAWAISCGVVEASWMVELVVRQCKTQPSTYRHVYLHSFAFLWLWVYTFYVINVTGN